MKEFKPIKLKGEKVLCVHIDEFYSPDEIKKALEDPEILENGHTHTLYNSKKECFAAFKKRNSQKQRCWFYTYSIFEGFKCYQLYEMLID